MDINAKKWMKEHPELASQNKSELLIRLAYELCLAQNTEYDPGNESEEQNNKHIRFDTQRIFALFEVANDLIEQSDRKSFVEFVCQKGNVQLLEMICRREVKDTKGSNRIEEQCKWKGTFTGYSKLIDLLQHVLKQPCSPEVVLCIAEKIYGTAHVFYNGEQYLDSYQAGNAKKSFDYQDSVIKEFLKQAIKLGYKDTVSVMLSGDIYHSIRLMKWKMFQENQEFLAAYGMVKETVADVISSWVEDKQSYKSKIQDLLDQGIEISMEKMNKEDLIYQLKYLGEEVTNKSNASKEKLMKELKKLGKEKGEVRLRSTILGALISTLFFKHQDEATKVVKGESFTLKTKHQEKSRKEKKLNELNQKVNSGESINGTVLELIESLNLGNHANNNWFFREVLVKVVSGNVDKLKAVCAAICKEPMQELLKGEEVHKDVVDVLEFFGVEVSPSRITTSEIPSSCASIGNHFMEDVNEIKKEAKEGCSSDELAFSGLTRKIIRGLEQKKDLTDKEDLISKAVSEIEKGINIFADGTVANIDVKDIFLSFELINSKIKKEQKREIVELICQKGNVQLLEMICQKEKKDVRGSDKVEQQYKWRGIFTGYSKLIYLLQYVIDNRCSPEVVLCIAEKIYGTAHVFYNGEQYLDSNQVKNIRGSLSYQDSVVKEFLKKAIKLGYKDTVLVMLSGDIYHSIRLMKWKVFKEKQEFSEAYDMIKETVADVISSWVKDKQFYKDYVRNSLDQGIETDMEEMKKEDLIRQLEYLGKKVVNKTYITKENLMKELKKLGGKKGKVRLRPTVLGALISTLFFKHQDEVMKGESLILKTTLDEKSKKEKILDELNRKINSGKDIDDTVLKLIKSLNSASHLLNNWFFREVLAKVVNENLDKLKAVCAAICKEPMEELLKGEEVHEDVIDVLQFFGVEKDFLLERSILENSDDALVRNSQGVEETLSNRSEKSISSSSRQSSADHDPQSSTVPISQGGKSIPSAASKKSCSASNLPSSRVAEKNNEGVMQNNCVQGGNPCYSINTGREFYYLNIPNSLMEDRMEESQQGGIISKMRKSLRKKSSNNRLPRISDLEDAHCERYRKAFLYKIFDYSKFIDFRSLREDPNTEKSCLSPNDSSSISLNASSFALNESCERDPYMDGMCDYDDGFDLLKEGNENQAKNKIRMAASKGFEGGMYAYAIIKFKEIMEGNITNSQEAVNEAVNYMVKSGKSFSPLNSFILGIVQLYNVGGYCEMIQCASQKSWKIHFADVLRSTKNTPFMDLIKQHNLLVYLGATNFDFTDSAEYLCVVGKEKGMKELESMIDHVKYELAKDMVSNKTDLVTAECLFRRLSDKSFSDAQYSYAVALFSDKFGRKENKNKEKEVHNLLIKAVRRQHQDTKLFLGRLLFKKEYELFHSNSYWNYLENYLDITCDNRDLKQKYLKEKIAIFIAYEYTDTHSLYVTPNQQKAKDILRKHCDNNELKKLEKAIEKDQEHSKSPCQLSNVLCTLKRVSSVFQKGGSDGLYTQELTDILKQLRDELKNSKITIQQSQILFRTLHQLNNTPLLKEQGFILLSQLCFILREEVNKQPNCHFKEKILLPIGELGKKCSDAQKRYFQDPSFVDITEPKARRYSATTTSQSQDRRYLHDSSFVDITEPKARRYSATPISQGFACPQTPSTVIRKVSLTRSKSSPELLPRRVLSSTRINSEYNALLETSMEDNVFQATASDIDGSISKLYNGLPFLVHANPDGGHLAVEMFVAAMGHCEKGEYDKAQSLFEKVFEERQSILGYEHCSTVMASHNMAMTLCAQDKFDEAIGILNEMLYKLKDHCHAQTIKGNMKIVLDMQAKKQEEARSIFSDGQSISKRGKSGSKLSNLSTRTEQEQSSGSSKQNVSEVTKSNKSSIGEVLCWDESTSESSQSFLRSRSVSGKLSATGMSSSHPSTNMDNLQTEKHTVSSESIGKR
ncbi:MAG: tetratricopeptide repeat protein [Wolbachia sp.]